MEIVLQALVFVASLREFAIVLKKLEASAAVSIFRLKACGGDINKNITYVQNDNYPSSFTTNSKTCTYKIYPAGEGKVAKKHHQLSFKTIILGICQLRLDFDIFVLNDPVLGATDQDRASNTCGDTFTVVPSAGGKQIGSLCGSTLTGSHSKLKNKEISASSRAFLVSFPKKKRA